MTGKTSITKEQALQKLKHYCAYQERAHSEVRAKLFEIGCWKKDHDEVISGLIEENFLNEERFAIAYARGKFSISKWGKMKIINGLKFKQVSPYCIKKALAQIDDARYEDLIRKLVIQKFNSLKGNQYLVRKKKTLDYMLQKGFESGRVLAILQELGNEKNKKGL